MSSTPRRRWQQRRLAALGIATSVAVLTAVVAGQSPATAGPTPGAHETRPFEPGEDDAGPDIAAPKSHSPSRVPAKNVPTVSGLPVTAATGTGANVDGLSFRDQRNANGGNSFSLEPPDQGLCVGNGQVIEAVNNVFSVYSTSGAQTAAPQSLVPFWNNGTPEIVRNPDGTATYGPFVSDPKCYYDPQDHRFFMTELQLTTDPATGDFTGDSYENIAVSRTSTATTNAADWYLYKLDVRNDGTPSALASPGGASTASHTGCPCLGDQPLIGADANGFYVTTNEFPIDGPGFNGAQIYAFDKASLESGTMRVQRIESNGLPLAEGTAYSVQPATSPTSGSWSTAANGTEFFLSALEFTGGFDNRVAAWALTNTASLRPGSTPNVHLSNQIVGSEVYGAPPAAEQAKGPTPLADSLKAKENLINSNDDRMNQVVYANGQLWSGLNTAIKTDQRHPTAGIAYFVVHPSADSASGVSATMTHQGYVAANGQSTIYPSIGVTAAGKGVMTFTLTGNRYYPTSAAVRLDASGVSGGIQVLGAGRAPADGFVGYPAYGGNGIERWGDYSAAVADASGNVWVASEYIPGTFGINSPERAYLANWGTRVASVTP